MPFYFFQWTDKLIEHLAEHDVSPDEFEPIVCTASRREPSRSSDRKIAFGYTSDGRYLACVYEVLDDGMTVIPVTAYELED